MYTEIAWNHKYHVKDSNYLKKLLSKNRLKQAGVR